MKLNEILLDNEFLEWILKEYRVYWHTLCNETLIEYYKTYKKEGKHGKKRKS